MRASCDLPVRRYFVHIPKTGGTTIIGVLDRYYAVDTICPWQLWSEVPQDPEFAEFQLTRGHFGAGGLDHWLDHQTRKLTMLRDPEALVISTFGHVRRETGTRFHSAAKEMSLGEFLEHPEAGVSLRNRQTAFLSFHPKDDPALDLKLFAPASAARVASELAENGTALSEEQRLTRALAALEQCEWFGLLDRFDDSMWLLGKILGSREIGPVAHARNERRDRETFRNQAKRCPAQVRKATATDRVLYETAKAEFETRLEAAKRHVSLPVNAKRDYAPNLGAGERFRYEFASALEGNGWHVREVQLPEEDYFRWTGPEPHSTLWLPYSATSVSAIRMRVVNGVDEEVLRGMVWRVNGATVVPEDLDGAGTVRQYCANGPFAARAGQKLRLEIILPHTHKLSDCIAGSEDTRRAGIAVHWVELANLDEKPEAN